MLRNKHLYFSVLSGILLGAPWLANVPGLVLCFAFIPLLLIAEDFLISNEASSVRQIYLYASLTFLIWNVMSTWWICYSTVVGGITIILYNTNLFAIVFTVYFISRRYTTRRLGFLIFISYWVCFEYVYTRAVISWPMLTLGNGLSNCPALIQWYDHTGAPGGSMWILAVNYVFMVFIREFWRQERISRTILFTGLILLTVPVLISLYRLFSFKEEKRPVHIVIIQPNIDPFYEKYQGMSTQQQVRIMKTLVRENVNTRTDYILLPETAIDKELNEDSLSANPWILQLKRLMFRYPNAELVLGASTQKTNHAGKALHAFRMKPNMKRGKVTYYNSAIQIDTTHYIPVYHKSKLVVGLEKIPYPGVMKYLSGFLPNLGGLSGNLGTQQERSVFESANHRFMAGTVICYESCFGAFTTGFVKNGANLLLILTNDGWFRNSPGPLIHLNYARMRAIENRRAIARDANTGISAGIDQCGALVNFLGYGRRGALKVTLNASDAKTFYTKHGDWIGLFMCLPAAILLLIVVLSILFYKPDTQSAQ